MSRHGLLHRLPIVKRRSKPTRLRHRVHDSLARFRHGHHAPRRAERVWVSPQQCNEYIKKRMLGRFGRKKGKVLSGNWDQWTLPLADHPKLRIAYAHWIDGVAWEHLGVYDDLYESIKKQGRQDQCQCWEDVIQRYETLDQIYSVIAETRRLPPHWEISGTLPSPREPNGIAIHINRFCEPVLGGEGEHRFMIARLLNLPYIPARIGLIHPYALPRWRKMYHAGACYPP